jgi:hypothetical protein
MSRVEFCRLQVPVIMSAGFVPAHPEFIMLRSSREALQLRHRFLTTQSEEMEESTGCSIIGSFLAYSAAISRFAS